MKIASFILLLSCLVSFSLRSATPVPYSGKVAINTVNFHGNAEFTFSLHDGNGTTHWRNGADANQRIQVFVRNGRYSILLGGQGMNVLPSEPLSDQDELYLKVHFDNHDGSGLRPLSPDQRITATPVRPGRGVGKDGQPVPGSFSGCHYPGDAQCGSACGFE